jgi:glycosyltransferase involved in cell wall biosynthesis
VKVLFLSIANISDGLYADLLHEFRDRGDTVYLVSQVERRHKLPTSYTVNDGIHWLRVRTGNIRNVGNIEKGISTILIEQQFINAIKKYLSDVQFDLVLYSTPPVTFERAIRYIKNKYQCLAYLLLKDIFPQNAVDMHMIKKKSLIWRYFRAKEKRLYAISDYIGCMSPANVAYVLKHNPEVVEDKIEVCPNSIKPKPLSEFTAIEGAHIRNKYCVPQNATLFVYGGNLGKPQGIQFLLKALEELKDKGNIFFLIVGSGVEYPTIKEAINKNKYKNVSLHPLLPKDDYDSLLSVADVGLIFLDHRFTIPNFPSRLLAHLESATPVLAATDIHTDIKDVILESKCGMWIESSDVKGFAALVEKMSSDAVNLKEMGLSGRNYLEKNYMVSMCYDIITSHCKHIP